MTCEEMIYREDYADTLINYIQGYSGSEELYNRGCLNPITQEIAILHYPRSKNFSTNLESMPYSFIPKLFGLMDSSNMEVVGVRQIQNENNIGLSGRETIVGIIDTGERVIIMSS